MRVTVHCRSQPKGPGNVAHAWVLNRVALAGAASMIQVTPFPMMKGAPGMRYRALDASHVTEAGGSQRVISPTISPGRRFFSP